MHISNNEIGGKMPTEIGKMLELKEFHAQNNEFINYRPSSVIWRTGKSVPPDRAQ
jgi:hypothetical protein